MMSTLPPSMNAGASQIEWIRSPVAIEVAVAARTRASAAPFSGGTGSSIQRGVRLERDGQLSGRVGREAAVHLDHEIDVRTDRLADGRDDGQRSPARGGVETDAGRPERVELHRPVAARHHRGGQLRDPVGLEIRLVPAVGVGRHPVPEPPAEELPDRHTQCLTDDVPRGDVEGGQRGLAVLARRPYSSHSTAQARRSVSNGSVPTT